MNNMLIGVITSTLSSYPPEVRRGATSGLQRTCCDHHIDRTLQMMDGIPALPEYTNQLGIPGDQALLDLVKETLSLQLRNVAKTFLTVS